MEDTIWIDREELFEVSEDTARFFEEHVEEFHPMENGSDRILYKHDCIMSDSVAKEIESIHSWMVLNSEVLDAVEIPEEAEGFEATNFPECTDVVPWASGDARSMEELKNNRVLVRFTVSVEGKYNNEEEEEEDED